jgi:CNT family concentrative nucleoside transporter
VESILSAPAALVTAKMLWPEDGVPTTLGATKLEIPKVDSNAVEAAARGASEGLTLAFNVAAMLIAFIALVKMMDGGLEWFTTKAFHHPVTFQRIAGLIFVPFAWFMGVPSEDCGSVGDMLGQKIVLNEFVAYGTLTKMLALKQALISQRAVMITSYALSGFANFGSIAIQIGGIGAMAPERRSDIASLGILALIAGSFATFMTACFAGALVSI